MHEQLKEIEEFSSLDPTSLYCAVNKHQKKEKNEPGTQIFYCAVNKHEKLRKHEDFSPLDPTSFYYAVNKHKKLRKNKSSSPSI